MEQTIGIEYIHRTRVRDEMIVERREITGRVDQSEEE